ncbi:hypothetical protein MRY87_04120 [bacterium]|nr:hypothetical protein [bacterium]
MKQLILFLLALGLGLGVYFYYDAKDGGEGRLANQTGDAGNGSASAGQASRSGTTINTSIEGLQPDGDLDFEEYDDRPASEIYGSYEEALAAVKKGALDYDDIILEQFVQPGEDCTFCPELYREVTLLMKNPNASEDEVAYYSELLAISGRKENIEALIESIESDPTTNSADIYAESLELTLGGDDVVRYLADYMENDNELLQESSVAAITNQESKLAAEILYEHTVKMGDADKYYEIGIGLGEFIPSEEALPFLQELTLKRDEFSHLAVKSLLNYGYDGVVMVFDVLANSNDAEFDRKMLRDAIDHLGYEEDTERLVKKILADNPSPVVKDFAQDILDGFELDDELDQIDEDEGDFSDEDEDIE